MSAINQNNNSDNGQENADAVSDVTKAANNANVAEIQKNIQQEKSVDSPEDLTAEQQTPFIDETVRTDK